MFPSETPRKIFSRGEKIEFNQKIPDTVGEAFRLPLRTLKKILTSITEANGKISLPLGEGVNRGALALLRLLATVAIDG